MTEEPDDPSFLTREALARIRASLPPGSDLSDPVCEIAAFAYVQGKAQMEAGTGRGLKADLIALEQQVHMAKTAIENTRFEILTIIGLFSEGGIPRFTALTKEFVWLEETLAFALTRLRGRYAKSHPWYLILAISILVKAFERATGKRATNSLHRDGIYAGEPLSPFGKFIIALLSEIDPQLQKRTIGSAIRKVFADNRHNPDFHIVGADGIRTSAQ